jgi:hypothetical protein
MPQDRACRGASLHLLLLLMLLLLLLFRNTKNLVAYSHPVFFLSCLHSPVSCLAHSHPVLFSAVLVLPCVLSYPVLPLWCCTDLHPALCIHPLHCFCRVCMALCPAWRTHALCCLCSVRTTLQPGWGLGCAYCKGRGYPLPATSAWVQGPPLQVGPPETGYHVATKIL